jgi:hypothetical protein
MGLLEALLNESRLAAAAFDGPTVARLHVTRQWFAARDLQREGMADELSEQLRPVLPVESIHIATVRRWISHR